MVCVVDWSDFVILFQFFSILFHFLLNERSSERIIKKISPYICYTRPLLYKCLFTRWRCKFPAITHVRSICEINNKRHQLAVRKKTKKKRIACDERENLYNITNTDKTPAKHLSRSDIFLFIQVWMCGDNHHSEEISQLQQTKRAWRKKNQRKASERREKEKINIIHTLVRLGIRKKCPSKNIPTERKNRPKKNKPQITQAHGVQFSKPMTSLAKPYHTQIHTRTRRPDKIFTENSFSWLNKLLFSHLFNFVLLFPFWNEQSQICCCCAVLCVLLPLFVQCLIGNEKQQWFEFGTKCPLVKYQWMIYQMRKHIYI